MNTFIANCTGALRRHATKLLLLGLCGGLLAPVFAADFKIGVYYFPGWKDNQVGAPAPRPWDTIKAFPEREPLEGWYQEGDVPLIEQQLGWMNQYGIDYVIFDWLWGRDNKTHLDHALNAYLRAGNRHNVQFAILWANHTDYVFTREQFQTMFQFWAQRYMFRKDYVRVDGKPVVFLFSANVLNKNAEKIGMTSAQLIDMADKIFKDNGLEGIKVIGGISGAVPGFDYSSKSGYAGFSAYNLHGPVTMRFAGGRQQTHDYEELDRGYQDQWQWMIGHVDNLYVVPMTAGWNRKPWGGSEDKRHDDSVSDPDEFQRHLEAGRKLMLSAPDKTQKMGVICCWNEYGEGSYIEPTKKYNFSYLEKVKKVFGTNK